MPDSGGFLFVCNSGVHTDDSKRLDPKRRYELSTEIDAFYALTRLGDGDIRRRLSDIAVLFQQRPGHKQPVVLYRKASRVARVRILRKVVQLP